MEFSSLANLKAEVARKRNEANLNKLHSKDVLHEKTKTKKEPIWAVKKKESEAKGSKSSNKVDPEEEKRIQSALELKARLYNKMKSGEVEDKDGRFLINFNKAGNSDSSDDDGGGRGDKVPDLISEDGRRELLRQKWEQEEEENMKKTKVHYNDVLFDEARTHGAAFYGFSRDEETREKELEELKELHERTKKEREEKEKHKIDKKTAMKNRLKKVRDRKRLKMGLPILETGSDSEADTPANDDATEKGDNAEDSILQRLREIRDKEDEAKRRSTVREWDVGKKADKSSSILTSKPVEAKVMNQKEWVEAKRSERPKEFAPPVNLYSEKEKMSGRDYSAVPPSQQQQHDQQLQQQQRFKQEKQKKQFTAQHQHPQKQKFKQQQHQQPQKQNHHQQQQQRPQKQNYHQQHPQKQNYHQQQPPHYSQQQHHPHQQKQPHQNRQQQHYPQHHQRQFTQQSAPSSFPPPSSSRLDPNDDDYDDDDEEEEALIKVDPISKSSRLEMHRQMKEGRFDVIVNEVDGGDVQLPVEAAQSEVGTSTARGGVEIPPPCSMDYYSNAGHSKRSNWQGMRTRDEMNEAFRFGMDQLKSKKAKRDEDSDDDSDG